MFSLIVTIISIALVVALAMAVIYYGGDATKQAATKAVVDTLLNQAAQVNAAGTIATAQGAGWPASAPQFSQPYLTAMPVPPKSAYVAGMTPQATDWEYYLSDQSSHHFVLRDKIRKDVCLAVNKLMGFDGIPAAWDGKSLIQCFGTGQNGPGAYTFFYDPVSSTAEQNNKAQEQSLTEGGTSTPGYPRLCADGTTIDSGLCPASGSPSGTPTGDAPSPFWDGQAPAQEECDANPSMPACNPAWYPALKIENIGGGYPVSFTAVKDCSYENTWGAICLPVFQSQHRYWEWAMPPEAFKETNEYANDGRLGRKSSNAMGFTISDGQNSYTVSQSHVYGASYQYVDIQEYPRTPSQTRGGTLAVSCAVMQQDIESKGGYFLPNKCDRFETGTQYAWNAIFSDAGNFTGDSVRDANPGWTTNYQSWGAIDYADMDDTHRTYHNSSGIGAASFIIGAYPTEIDERIDLHVGQEGGWPLAPLSTDRSGGGY